MKIKFHRDDPLPEAATIFLNWYVHLEPQVCLEDSPFYNKQTEKEIILIELNSRSETYFRKYSVTLNFYSNSSMNESVFCSK